LEETEADYVLI